VVIDLTGDDDGDDDDIVVQAVRRRRAPGTGPAPAPAAEAEDPPRPDLKTMGLLCIICHDKMKDPVITKCGHLFCRGCVTEWLANIDKQSKRVCPTCRKGATLRDLRPAFLPDLTL